jgi:dTDP-4-dehydrorhamnose reductase
MRILILGSTGMLGHVLFTELSMKHDLEVYATVRSLNSVTKRFPEHIISRIKPNIDARDLTSVEDVLQTIRPEVVINCIGLVKQLPLEKDPITAITINSLFPHQLALACKNIGARLIHISTDCVFNGKKGNYTEKDLSDAENLYGRTKYLGEVTCSHCLTLRTSIIGHELEKKLGLIEWFMAQRGSIQGYTKYIYTGFPTVELANIIKNYVIPNKELKGIYQASSDPISKYELLKLIAQRYEKQININPYDGICLDHSLNSEAFRHATGYKPPPWPEMIAKMYRHYISSALYSKVKE